MPSCCVKCLCICVMFQFFCNVLWLQENIMNLYREHYYLPGWTKNIKTFHNKKSLTAHFLVIKAFIQFDFWKLAAFVPAGPCLTLFGGMHQVHLYWKLKVKTQKCKHSNTNRGLLTFACHCYSHYSLYLLLTPPSAWGLTRKTTGTRTRQRLSEKCCAARNCHSKLWKDGGKL